MAAQAHWYFFTIKGFTLGAISAISFSFETTLYVNAYERIRSNKMYALQNILMSMICSELDECMGV